MTDRLEQREIGAYMALIDVANRLQHLVGEQLRQTIGLTQAQFEILARVAAAPGGMRMSEIAEASVVSRSGMTYRVDQLEKLGLVTRADNTEDERSIMVFATPKGIALFETALPSHIALVREAFLRTLSRQDLDDLAGFLERVSANLRDPAIGS